jgi:hypothetical protein
MSALARWTAWLRAALLRVGGRCSDARVIGLLVLFLATGLLMRRGIDGALASMHLPGAVSADAGGVAGVEALLDPQRTRAGFESWTAWSAAPGADRYLEPAALLAGYVVVDILLVGLPLVLLLLAGLRSVRDNAARHSSDTYPLREATVTVAANAVLPAAAFLVADLAEDGLLLAAGTGGARTWQLVLLGSASLAAWSALILAGSALLLARLALGFAGSTSGASLAPGPGYGSGPVPGSGSPGAGGLAVRIADRSVRTVFAPVIILRAQVLTVGFLVVVLLLLQGDLGRQVQDVLLGLPERPVHQLVVFAAALVFAALTYGSGRLCETAYRRPPGRPGGTLAVRALWLSALAGVAVVGAGLALLWVAGQSLGWALIPPGVLLVTFAVLSGFREVRQAWSGEAGVSTSPATRSWLRVLVSLPVAAVGLVAAQGVVTLGVAREIRHALNLAALALLFMVLAMVPFLWRALWARVESATRSTLTNLALAGGATVVVGVGVWGAVDPWSAGERLGSVGVVFVLFAWLLLAVTVLVLAGDRWAARGALAFVRLRRVPLISLVVVSLVATSYLDTGGRYHDVRLLPGPADGRGEPMSVEQAFAAWVADHRPAGAVTGKVAVPMVFMATGGGGIRAAYWTTTVLDCLFTPGYCDRTLPAGSAANLFAASGISGGSLGLAAFRAGGDGERPARTVVEDADFAAPVLAGLAFRDVPNAVLHADLGWLDRAGILEIAWERAGAAHGSALTDGFAEASFDGAGGPRFPLLLFSGAAVEDGCRVTVSVLDTAPVETTGAVTGRQARSCDSLDPFADTTSPTPVIARSRDVFDYTCGAGRPARDLRLSTAALISARFPYVSPTGGLTSCADPQRRSFVLDGGLIESSGAGPLVELWTSLAPLVQQANQDPDSGICLQPRLIMIDNGYAETRLDGLPRRPPELLAPVQADSAAAGMATAAARQAAAIAFRATLGQAAACRHPDGGGQVPADPAPGTGSVVQLYPRSHPGPLAPLGWSLSSWAQADLRSQLSENTAQLDRVRAWFAPAAGSP